MKDSDIAVRINGTIYTDHPVCHQPNPIERTQKILTNIKATLDKLLTDT